MRKWLYFTMIAFVMAMIHACSMNNGILKPTCQIFQIQLVDRWWTATTSTNGVPSQVYFNSNGLMQTKVGNDSVTYSLQNCNSLFLQNHTTSESKQWIVNDVAPDHLILQIDNKTTVTYKPK